MSWEKEKVVFLFQGVVGRERTHTYLYSIVLAHETPDPDVAVIRSSGQHITPLPLSPGDEACAVDVAGMGEGGHWFETGVIQ